MNNDRINGKAIMSKQERSSNFELARIICMIMIMILHADNLSLGIPSFEDLVFCMLFVMLMIERIRQYLFDKVFL